jgi:hypothetical protein
MQAENVLGVMARTTMEKISDDKKIDGKDQ